MTIQVVEVRRDIGPRGPAGGVQILGSVATSAALPASGQSVGTAWITENDGHAWTYTGSVAVGAVNGWIDLGPVAVSVLPLPLYAITGYTVALPPGEVVVSSHASESAFAAAVVPAAAGEQVQLAQGLTIRRLVADWNGTSFVWGDAS